YCLSGHASAPCSVVQHRQITVMLDCSLSMVPALHFLPVPVVTSERLSSCRNWNNQFMKSKVIKDINGIPFIDSMPEFRLPEMGFLDLLNLDAILISNFYCMLALPYITERCEFHGKIYATEPTLQMGKLLMEELVFYNERVSKSNSINEWKQPDIIRFLPSPLNQFGDIAAWKSIYTIKEVEACLSKVQAVRHLEKLDLFGAFNVTALSSGFCLGSSNWILESPYEKISYLSCSSIFSTHPMPLDQEALKKSDIVILTGLSQVPYANPDQLVTELCNNLAFTLKNGGNVLIPSYPTGIIYDLLECLCTFMDQSGLGNIPIYFISPVADSSLAFSNIYGEWLCNTKQDKVYLPEPPFIHADLVKTKRLQHFPNLQDGFGDVFSQPCVVFAGHPCLRIGDAVHFMEMWRNDEKSSVIFIEPDFPYEDALAPFQPLSMKAFYCPIDHRLNFNQVNKLLQDIKPQRLVLPESYVRPYDAFGRRIEHYVNASVPTHPYNKGDVLALPLKRQYEKVVISNELASQLHLSEVNNSTLIASVRGSLHVCDNKHTLEVNDR
ncbi:uncharacterized protein TRIADDRAFT_32062, partial [Trichoplax adhaerens]